MSARPDPPVVLLSNDFALPVTAAFMEGSPGTPASTVELFTLPLAPAMAAFLFPSALAHFIVAGPGWGSTDATWRRIGTSSVGSSTPSARRS